MGFNRNQTDGRAERELLETLHLAELIELARERGVVRNIRFLPDRIDIDLYGASVQIGNEEAEDYLRTLISDTLNH